MLAKIKEIMLRPANPKYTMVVVVISMLALGFLGGYFFGAVNGWANAFDRVEELKEPICISELTRLGYSIQKNTDFNSTKYDTKLLDSLRPS